jgi:uncharacterized Zn-binding protein involved in type VI secretion
MGTPAAVVGDRVMGASPCAAHQIPNPASGVPQPSPPMPFSAPITNGVVANVIIAGKPAVVAGCTGLNAPPHVGLHLSDPYMLPAAQIATVTQGSTSVLIGGRPAARTASACATVCFGAPGNLVGTASTVLIG